MSGASDRIRRVLGGSSGDALASELARRVDELERSTEIELQRQVGSMRELTTDLIERITALEQRIAALEARSQDD